MAQEMPRELEECAILFGNRIFDADRSLAAGGKAEDGAA